MVDGGWAGDAQTISRQIWMNTCAAVRLNRLHRPNRHRADRTSAAALEILLKKIRIFILSSLTKGWFFGSMPLAYY
jgi:hypothetical protein